MVKTLLVSVLAGVVGWTLEADPRIQVRAIGKHVTGITGFGATEIAAFDPESKRLFSVNGAANSLEILDLSDPATPILLSSIAMASCAPGSPTSVDFATGLSPLLLRASSTHNPVGWHSSPPTATASVPWSWEPVPTW